MVRRKLVGLFVCCLVMAIGSVAIAGIPSLTLSTATTAAASRVSVYNLPNGFGSAFTQAKVINSSTLVNATITLTLKDGNGDPIFQYPFEDLWLETSLGGMKHCAGGTVADASTDGNGVTTFSVPLYAGGSSSATSNERTVVMVSGSALTATLDILFNSADITGDLKVDLSDTSEYVYNLKVAYGYRADFYYDGVINISDTSMYVSGLGKACP